MYLHNILQKDTDELVRRVFQAQKENTNPGDFYDLVSEDKKSISLNMTDLQIQLMNKDKFRSIVKKKTRLAAFNYLKTLQEGSFKNGRTEIQYI